MLSTTSFVLRSPAVSATMTGKPPMSSESSRISRVVPGMGVTIAASRCAAPQSGKKVHGHTTGYTYPGSSEDYSCRHWVGQI